MSNESYNLWFATEFFKLYNHNALNASLRCISVVCYIEVFDVYFYYNLWFAIKNDSSSILLSIVHRQKGLTTRFYWNYY